MSRVCGFMDGLVRMQLLENLSFWPVQLSAQIYSSEDTIDLNSGAYWSKQGKGSLLVPFNIETISQVNQTGFIWSGILRQRTYAYAFEIWIFVFDFCPKEQQSPERAGTNGWRREKED